MDRIQNERGALLREQSEKGCKSFMKEGTLARCRQIANRLERLNEKEEKLQKEYDDIKLKGNLPKIGRLFWNPFYPIGL